MTGLAGSFSAASILFLLIPKDGALMPLPNPENLDVLFVDAPEISASFLLAEVLYPGKENDGLGSEGMVGRL